MNLAGGNKNLVGNKFIQRSDGVLKTFSCVNSSASRYDTFRSTLDAQQLAVPTGKKWLVLFVSGVCLTTGAATQNLNIGHSSTVCVDTPTVPTSPINGPQFIVLNNAANTAINYEICHEIPAGKYPYLLSGGNLFVTQCLVVVLEVPA